MKQQLGFLLVQLMLLLQIFKKILIFLDFFFILDLPAVYFRVSRLIDDFWCYLRGSYQVLDNVALRDGFCADYR